MDYICRRKELNYMIEIDDIYQATRGGLDIILDLYPQARGCEVSPHKAFAMRDERTPSAHMKKPGDSKYWIVTDFGGSGKAMNPIDLYMQAKGYSQARFAEAIKELAARYHVVEGLKSSVNRATYSQRPARADEVDGESYLDFNEGFTDSECRVMGPKVTREHLIALHWMSVKTVIFVSKRVAHIFSSNENYPIFARECWSSSSDAKPFYKIYQPLNPDKGRRFQYTPKGAKSRDYINGLKELKDEYLKYNEAERNDWESLHDDKPYKEKKLKEAVLCSGERDSLCVRSLGYFPIWLNSETADLSYHDYNQIMKYVEVLYNIPDIDETGIRRGIEVAKTHIDIHTIWLPDWLRDFRDNRHKPCKDFRDWMEHGGQGHKTATRRDFLNLMRVAMPARFWCTNITRNGDKKHSIDTICLYNFLALYGFHALHDDNSGVTQYIRIKDNIVKAVQAKELREFTLSWLRSRYEDRDILNLVVDSPKLSGNALESLSEITLDFTNYTPTSQFFFFPKATVEVTAAGLIEHKPGDGSINNYVWEENVIPHTFRKLDDMFTITHHDDEFGRPVFDITVNYPDDTNRGIIQSNFFGYLINSSRIHWRKELEENFSEIDAAETERYRNRHLFDIAGQGLTDDEISEQKLNLMNKIFTIGYMLHRYKSPSRAWAPMAMDNKIGEDNACNGRSGKSFLFKTLSMFLKTVKLSGRNPRLMDNPHVFDQVTQHTNMLLIDDCDKYLNTGLFYDNITSDMTVNPKNNRSFNIKFEDSPKLAFTTNFVPGDFDPSSEARLIYMTFSDYYHQKTEENDYIDTRSIRDDFNKDLFGSGYTEEEWNADINCILQCVRFYLSVSDRNVRIIPNMENIIRRKHKADMGVNFEEWANIYFDEEEGHVNTLVAKDSAFRDFQTETGSKVCTMQAFTRKIKAFVQACPWIAELNPKEYQNNQGRIIRRESDVPGGPSKVKEMIYLRTRSEAKDLAEKAAGTSSGNAVETELPWPKDKPF